MTEDNKSVKALSHSPHLPENKPLPVSPYRQGIKDKNFINPSLISHDVFYNMEYPKVDKSIPYCRKRQTVTDKITNLDKNYRSLTPEPVKNCVTTQENEQKSYNPSVKNTPNHQIKENAIFFARNQQNCKSQQFLHEEDYKPTREVRDNNNNDMDFGDRQNYNNPNTYRQNEGNMQTFIEKPRIQHCCDGAHEHNNNNRITPTNFGVPPRNTVKKEPILNNPQYNDNFNNNNMRNNNMNIIPIEYNAYPNNGGSNGVNNENNYEIQKKEAIPQKTPNNNNDNQQNDTKPQENDFDMKSVRSNTGSVTTFTRNKDNLICDYCINQDLIDRKNQEKLLEAQRNRQIKELNENFYHSMMIENANRQTERKKQLKDNREAQLQTIEGKKNQYASQKNFVINYERETNRITDEELRLAKQREANLEREKREILRQELENQINSKRREKLEYITERNSSKDTALNIDNRYHNPYLPGKREYIEEIERQKAMNQEKINREKEDQRKSYLLNLELKKKAEVQEEKIKKEELSRKQQYAQKILQDIEDRKKREMQQKESEKSHYRNLFEKQNEDEKNLTLQQFYDKKLREARMAQTLKDQIFERKNLNSNSQNDERIRKELAEIEDLLAAQRIKNYNCKKCHKNYPKSVLNIARDKSVKN